LKAEFEEITTTMSPGATNILNFPIKSSTTRVMPGTYMATLKVLSEGQETIINVPIIVRQHAGFSLWWLLALISALAGVFLVIMLVRRQRQKTMNRIRVLEMVKDSR